MNSFVLRTSNDYNQLLQQETQKYLGGAYWAGKAIQRPAVACASSINFDSTVKKEITEEKKPATTSTESSGESEQKKTSTTEEQQQQGEKKEGEEDQEKKTEEEPRKEKTFKEKLISKLKWGSFFTVFGGTITFLFYESHLRSSLPYRLVMDAVQNDVDCLRKFGGHIASNKWYMCFERPITGYITTKEGNVDCFATFSIPIIRYIAPPLKEGEEAVTLPEDEMTRGYDGGAHQGYVYATLNKRSSWFYDWQIQTLSMVADDGTTIEIVNREIKL
eukprot:gene15078-17850_t